MKIPWTAWERRSRDVLVAAVVGRPESLPDAATLDLGRFWLRFDETAPVHLALGFRAANIVLSAVAPRVLGHAPALAGLPRERQEAVLEWAARGPAAPLVEVAKVVACLAYFANPTVQDRARGRT